MPALAKARTVGQPPSISPAAMSPDDLRLGFGGTGAVGRTSPPPCNWPPEIAVEVVDERLGPYAWPLPLTPSIVASRSTTVSLPVLSATWPAAIARPAASSATAR